MRCGKPPPTLRFKHRLSTECRYKHSYSSKKIYSYIYTHIFGTAYHYKVSPPNELFGANRYSNLIAGRCCRGRCSAQPTTSHPHEKPSHGLCFSQATAFASTRGAFASTRGAFASTRGGWVPWWPCPTASLRWSPRGGFNASCKWRGCCGISCGGIEKWHLWQVGLGDGFPNKRFTPGLGWVGWIQSGWVNPIGLGESNPLGRGEPTFWWTGLKRVIWSPGLTSKGPTFRSKGWKNVTFVGPLEGWDSSSWGLCLPYVFVYVLSRMKPSERIPWTCWKLRVS